ncbi:MAG: glycine hydroxymethyltransferase [Myxococcales bacterium]|nr:MAG: glycine hydroxymethyltransferase [Myxococcales bacterium]
MNKSALQLYLDQNASKAHAGAASFYAALDQVATVSPSISKAIAQELADQRSHLKLIASENYCSLATQLASANLFTDKYAEGFAGHRFYAGCENVDTVESEACQLACELFGAEHAYVQPHSGADANMVAFFAILSARVQAPLLETLNQSDLYKLSDKEWQNFRAQFNNQRLLALNYYAGGHLTHGYRHNVSSRLFQVSHYGVDSSTGLVDMDALAKQAKEVKPLVLLAGYSAYPRKLNFAKMRQIADDVGAVLMVDMAHFAGLVAGKVFTGDFDPVPHAHVVTSTTHKTLRGPRGGLVLCKNEFAEWVDKGCPAVLGGPLPHVMASKAIAFREALKPEFKTYAQSIVDNSQALAVSLKDEGIPVLTGGTDNHIVLVNVSEGFGLTGRQAETALRECRLTLNRNSLPNDPNGAWYTSGLRLGTAAVSTIGMTADDMKEIASITKLVLSNTKAVIVAKGERKGQKSLAKYTLDESVKKQAQERVAKLMELHRPYPELDLQILQEAKLLS